MVEPDMNGCIQVRVENISNQVIILQKKVHLGSIILVAWAAGMTSLPIILKPLQTYRKHSRTNLPRTFRS